MSDKQPKFRSPPYPYVALSKALARAEQLYGAVRHHSAAVPMVAKAWEIGPKSSATLQSIAALTQFGLVEQEGTGDTRRVKLTPSALQILMDKRPTSVERDKAIKEAALTPRIFAELYESYGPAKEIDDALLIHALTAERVQAGKAPFSEQSAAEVLRVFRDTVSFAKLDGAVVGAGDIPSAASSEPPHVGDHIQWLVGDAWQFDEPRKVRAVSEDGAWVFVDGSETGIPSEQCEVIEPAKSAAPEVSVGATPPTLPIGVNSPAMAITPVAGKDNIKILLESGRLQVTASVDRNGLRRLQRRLAAFEALLDEEEKEDSEGGMAF